VSFDQPTGPRISGQFLNTAPETTIISPEMRLLMGILGAACAAAIDVEIGVYYVAIHQQGVMEFRQLSASWDYSSISYDYGSAKLILVHPEPKRSVWQYMYNWWGSVTRFDVHRFLDNSQVPEDRFVIRAKIGGWSLFGPKPSMLPNYEQRILSGRALQRFVSNTNLELPRTIGRLKVSTVTLPFSNRDKNEIQTAIVPLTRRPLGFQVSIAGVRYNSLFKSLLLDPEVAAVLPEPEQFGEIYVPVKSLPTRRPVFLAVYYSVYGEQRMFRMVKNLVMHHEIHVGETSIYISIDSNHRQHIQFRPVAKATTFAKFPIQKKIFMCETYITDNNLLNYARKNWHGKFCMIDNGCQDFSELLIKYACVDKLGMDPRFNSELQFPKSNLKKIGKIFQNVPLAHKWIQPGILRPTEWATDDWTVSEYRN
jgi:hypothetical protein